MFSKILSVLGAVMARIRLVNDCLGKWQGKNIDLEALLLVLRPVSSKRELGCSDWLAWVAVSGQKEAHLLF